MTLKKPCINQNPVYNPTKVIYKYNEMSKFIDYLKDNFKLQENIDSDIHEYNFFSIMAIIIFLKLKKISKIHMLILN